MEDKTPYKPPKIGHSPSDISKKSEYKKAFSEKVSLSPLYTHWFAIELAELHSSVDYDAVMVKMVVNGIQSEVSQEKLKNVCDHLQLVEIMSNARRGYFAGTVREETYTSLISFWIQDFLGIANLCCLHQLPSGNGSSNFKPDTHIVKIIVKDNTIDLFTILINNFKLASNEQATIQSHAYAVHTFEKNHGECSLIIGLPMTREEITLWVYLAFNEKLLAIKIASVNYCNDRQGLKRLMCVLYGCVHSLAEKRITSNNPKLLTLKCCEGNHRVMSGNCVICETTKKVTKMYDIIEKPYLKPNVDLIQASDIQLKTFCKGRIIYLQYKYVEGNHQPPNLRAIVDIIKNLNRIHQAGFVHGDIRRSNIVYGSNTGTFIDFDFAAKEGSLYPELYSPFVEERAKDATKNSAMLKLHDRIALFNAIFSSYVYLTDFQYSILRNLLLLKKPLREIISQLEKDAVYH